MLSPSRRTFHTSGTNCVVCLTTRRRTHCASGLLSPLRLVCHPICRHIGVYSKFHFHRNTRSRLSNSHQCSTPDRRRYSLGWSTRRCRSLGEHQIHWKTCPPTYLSELLLGMGAHRFHRRPLRLYIHPFRYRISLR